MQALRFAKSTGRFRRPQPSGPTCRTVSCGQAASAFGEALFFFFALFWAFLFAFFFFL